MIEGGKMVKFKGNTRRASKPNFWRGYEEVVPNNLKEMIYDQYLSFNTLSIYCDSSSRPERNEMTVACTYVQNGLVIVKQKIIYPPRDCLNKNIYGELSAVMFGFAHFKKHMQMGSTNVVIYSDVNQIEGFVNNQNTFKKNLSLKKLQNEMIAQYETVSRMNPEITIKVKYLQPNLKKHNPFARSSHNACKQLLNRKR